MEKEIKEEIREAAFGMGADVCGFSSIDRLDDAPKGFSPTDIFGKCKSLLTLGVSLPKGMAYINPQLIYCYFNSYSQTFVDGILFRLAKDIERKYDCIAVPLPCDMAGSWDEKTATAHGILSVKHMAVKAGIGFMGKNTILCNKDYGNMMTIGTILLSIDIPSDELAKNYCLEKCHICIDNCPAHAIREDGTVNQQLCRPIAYGKKFGCYNTVECDKCRIGCPLRFGVRKQ